MVSSFGNILGSSIARNFEMFLCLMMVHSMTSFLWAIRVQTIRHFHMHTFTLCPLKLFKYVDEINEISAREFHFNRFCLLRMRRRHIGVIIINTILEWIFKCTTLFRLSLFSARKHKLTFTYAKCEPTNGSSAL